MKSYFTSSMARTATSLVIVTALAGISGPTSMLAQDSNTPAASAVALPDHAQPVFGAIAGVVRSSAKVPITGAMVTAVRTDGKGIWTTITGTDGIYSISNITPGEYQVTLQAEGFPDITVSTLQVAAGRATRSDIAIAANIAAPPIITSSNSSTPNLSTPTAPTFQAAQNQLPDPPSNAAKGVLSRLARDLMGTRTPTAAPVNTASLIPPASAFDTRAASDSAFPTLPSPQGPAAPAAQGSPAASSPTAPETDLITPFADYDWTWLNGNSRQHDSPLDTKYFSPEIPRGHLLRGWISISR